MRYDAGLTIGNLTLRLKKNRNVKLFVFRNDKKELPHLTISFQNASTDIDLHLTSRISRGIENHQPIAKIPESVLLKAFEALGAKVPELIINNLSKAQKVRPGWLARHGYVVLHISSDMQQRLLPILAPKQKRHGKWTRTVDKEVITGKNQPQEIIDAIRHPAVLHELATYECREPIFAVSGRKKCKHRFISLMLIRSANGRHRWVRVDNLARDLMNNFGPLMISKLKELLPNDTWATIQSALQLEDIRFEPQ